MNYYCQWWITRLAGRGRTQPAALTGVKCRTRRALDIRTHIAASGHPLASFVWASFTKSKTIKRPGHVGLITNLAGFNRWLDAHYTRMWCTLGRGQRALCVSCTNVSCVRGLLALHANRLSKWTQICWYVPFYLVRPFCVVVIVVYCAIVVKWLHWLCYISTSDQARLPAEFKHINKRRKRNQTGFP